MAGGLDFLINIQQKLSGGNVAGELATLESRIKGETKALQNLEQWMRRLQSAGSVDIAQHQKVAGLIDQKKASLAGLSEQLVQAGAAEGQAGTGAESLGEKLSALSGGPVGMIAAALATLITILVAAAVKLTSFAIQAADAARSFRLVLEGASGSAKAAAELDAAVNRVAASTSVLQPELEKMAQTLAVAGLKGALFEQTLKTMAAVASVAGPQAAGKLEEIAKKVTALGHFEIGGDSLAGLGISMEDLARSMGTSVDKLKADMKAGKVSVEDGISAMNKALNTRFVAVAAKQALGFNVQIAKLHENLGKLFKGVDLEPFLKALKEVLSVFDQQTASGQAMAYMLSTFFSGLFRTLSNLGPLAKRAFQELIITGLRLYIIFAPAARVFERFTQSLTTADTPASSLAGSLTRLGYLFTSLFTGIVGATGVIDTVFLEPLGRLLGIKIPTIKELFGSLLTGELPDFSSITSSVGTSLVDGLIRGVTSRASAFLGALTGMVSGGVAAVKGLLKIKSPSGVFAEIGDQTVAGFTGSVDAGAEDAQASMGAMVAPPEARGEGRRVAAGGNGGPLLVIQHLEIHGDGAADIWDQFEEKLTALLEGVALSGPEPAGAT